MRRRKRKARREGEIIFFMAILKSRDHVFYTFISLQDLADSGYSVLFKDMGE